MKSPEEIIEGWFNVVNEVTNRPQNERRANDVKEALLEAGALEEKEIIRQDLIAQGYDPKAVASILDGIYLDPATEDIKVIKQAARLLHRAYGGRLRMAVDFILPLIRHEKK